LRQEHLTAMHRLIQSEVALLRQLGRDRRLASTRLPVLTRTGRDSDQSHSKGRVMTHSPAATARNRLAPLSANEEISLRRVAHGQSDMADLRMQDLARLRALDLITADPRVPMLTAEGQRRFDALAKPVALARFDAHSEIMALLDRATTRPTARPTAAGRRAARGETGK
jgi:hypothetical protein